MFYKFVDLSHARKVFVVGDIHGMFGELEAKLYIKGFDPQTDHLISVGDLIDRGPDCYRAVEFADQPWFHFVRGNHEDMMASAHRLGEPHLGHHTKNGGSWFESLSGDKKDEFVDKLFDRAPVVLEVQTPTKRIGIAHANIPTNDWDDVKTYSLGDWEERHCLWNRLDVGIHRLVRGIDDVYFGHTPKAHAIHNGNCHWIDTGAVYGGYLTLLEIV